MYFRSIAPTHFSRVGAKNFPRGLRPPALPLVTGLVWTRSSLLEAARYALKSAEKDGLQLGYLQAELCFFIVDSKNPKSLPRKKRTPF